MRNSLNKSDWSSQIYYRWVFLPVLMFLLSLLTGWGMFIVFPILITVAYCLTLKQYEAVKRPALWFITLPITAYVWIRWGPMRYVSNKNPNSLLFGVMAYYGSQMVNAFFIPLLMNNAPSSTGFNSNQQSTDLTIRWLLATLVSAAIWLVLFGLVNTISGGAIKPGRNTPWDITGTCVYPLISLVANSLGGRFLADNPDE